MRSMVEGACALAPFRHARVTGLVRFGIVVGGLGWATAASADMSAQPIAVLQGLDKVSAHVSKFEAPVGQTVGFGTLSIVVRDCQHSAPEDTPENAAFIEISETKEQQKTRLFSGWMFSSSPALSALEHPVYDVTLLECKGAAPPQPPPTPNPTTSPTGKSRGKSAR